LDELFEKMRQYFTQCEYDLQNAKSARSTRTASIPDLCMYLKFSGRNEFDAMLSGDEEQVRFYNEVLMRYESLCERYRALGMIDAKQLETLQKTLFQRQAGDGKTGIVVVMPDFKAPDEWEDFLAIKEICDEHEILLRQAAEILRGALS
jgi:hypothetical protein